VSLLELEHVGKRYGRGSNERVALQDISLVLDAGEMLAVWGERRSGRSTLLRVAAGIEAPNVGAVRFDGRDLAQRGSEVLGGDIGYCRQVFRPSGGQTVLDHLVAGQLARGISRSKARSRSWRALERVDAVGCANHSPNELNSEEAVRAAVARALSAEPRLLVIDEPTIGVNLLARDKILLLLRSLADEGIAVLTSTGEGTGLLAADRVLSLSDGKVRGELTPHLAPVTTLHPGRQASG